MPQRTERAVSDATRNGVIHAQTSSLTEANGGEFEEDYGVAVFGG